MLIDSGTIRKAIKVRGNCIFVNSRPHAKVINGALVFNPTLADHSAFQRFASNDGSTSTASNCDPPPISSPASTSSANISSNDSSSNLSSPVESDSHTSSQ